MSNQSCRYQVDAEDKLISIEGGESLYPSPPLNQSIWTFIKGLSTRFIYQMLISQVRETETAVQFPFRCDSAEFLRYMEMEISPGENDSVWFQTTLKRQIETNALPNYSGPTPIQEAAVKMCAWCKLVLVGSSWLSLEDAIWLQGLLDTPEAPPITHGLCPDCNRSMRQEITLLKTA
jgi:hypothetical protein